MTNAKRHRSFTSTTRNGVRRWMLSALLACAAMPAFAQQAPATTAASAAPAEPAMSLSERARVLATDINRLIAPGLGGGAGGESSGRVQTVLSRAFALLGTPYRWGGTSPEGGFDCSGLVGYVFRNALGVELPRVSRDMAKTGAMVDRSQLAAGDLVFFGKGGSVDHVGIYVGEGQFVHAPRTGRDVTVSRMDTGYWSAKYLQGRRVAGI